MQLPIHSFNTKHAQQDVRVETKELLFNLSSIKEIEITTGDEAVANYLGIPRKTLGFTSDEEMQQNEAVLVYN